MSSLKRIKSFVKEPLSLAINETSVQDTEIQNIVVYVLPESVLKYKNNLFWAKFADIRPLSVYEQDRIAEQEVERAEQEDERARQDSIRAAERAKKVQGVEITSQHRDYVYGETAQLAWKVYPETAENKAVKFISSNPTVASVSYERGLINFISPGVATIFVVTKEGGFADSIDIKVKAHSNTYLSSLTASTPYEPKFNKDILNYTSIVPYKVSEVIVDAEPEDFMASVNIKEYSLNVGNNVIPVTVTAEDGETKKTYNLNVKRLNNDARLRTLSFSQGSLTPGFSREHSDYTLTVSKEDPLITVSGITNDENATVEFPSEFYTKDTTFFIKVVAEDTTFSRLYRIKLQVMNDNAYLQYLRVEGFTVTPDFQPFVFDYYTVVPKDTKQVNILAFPQDTQASVDGDVGYRYVTGDRQTFTVTVTAQDKKTRSQYTINLKRDLNTTGITLTDKPTNEYVKVYGLDGRLLYETDKIDGKIVLPEKLSNKILIIRGSGGWPEKVKN